MRRANKKKKAQMMVLNEVKQQLLLQAERWGRKGFYTPIKLEEMELEACKRIMGDLLAEKANLEYQMNAIAENSKEIDVKLSKLEGYLTKANRVAQGHHKSIDKMLENLIGNRKKVLNALERTKMTEQPAISVLLSDN